MICRESRRKKMCCLSEYRKGRKTTFQFNFQKNPERLKKKQGEKYLRS